MSRVGYRKDEEIRFREAANIRFIDWSESLFEQGLEVGVYIVVGTLVSEVIKAAELIEEAMTAAIDKEHVATWPDLYERLSQEEKNCLFHSMQSNLIPEKRALLQYGALNNRLFFIEKGTVVVATPQEGSKKLKVFAQLGRGDVLVFNGEVGEYLGQGVLLLFIVIKKKPSENC